MKVNLSHNTTAARTTARSETQPSQQNFLVLVLYSVIVRTGWIFKTESIIMPAILDAIGGGGWMRGCLPMLNRIGQSLPPLLAAERIRQAAYQKQVLSLFVMLMGASFLLLALVWGSAEKDRPVWLPYLYLAVYGFFWLCVGIHNLSISLLYGKLVAADARGRLMLVGMTLGAVSAVAFAWFLMRRWLAGGPAEFVWLFLFTGMAFVVAGMVAWALQENPDRSRPKPTSLKRTMARSLVILKRDRNFRLLAFIAATFGVSVTLMPHYQAYARQNLTINLESMVSWVIVQNLGAAAFSIPVGKIADRFGNRMAIQTVLLLLCCAPVLSLLNVNLLQDLREMGSCIVFFLLGLMPVTMRIFNNYTLEIAARHRQPIYLSTLGICMALPVVLMSTLVGGLVDLYNFELVFMAVVAIVAFGWILTFRLSEPRNLERNGGQLRQESVGID